MSMTRRQYKLQEFKARLASARMGQDSPIRVRCVCQLHHINFSVKGQLILQHHSRANKEDDQAICAIAGSELFRCYNVLKAVKARFDNLNATYSNRPLHCMNKLHYINKSAHTVPKKLLGITYHLWKLKSKYPSYEYQQFEHISRKCQVELSNACIAAERLWHKLPISDRAGRLKISVTLYGTTAVYLSLDKSIHIIIGVKQWLLRVWKQGLTVLDGYPIFDLPGPPIYTDDDGRQRLTVLTAVRYGDNSLLARQALFVKTYKRKVWWKFWQKRELTWQLEKWLT